MTKLNKMAGMRDGVRSFKVLLECIGCKDRKEVDPRDVKEQPMCEKCYMPMVTLRAEIRR